MRSRRFVGGPQTEPWLREDRSTLSPAIRMALLAGLLVATGVLTAGLSMAQTVPLPPEEIIWDLPSPTGGGAGGERIIWPGGRINYLYEMDQISRFLDLWQNRVPGPDYGGMIEAESGPLGGVIQTDNTLEAIWVWSHYTSLTGTTEYLDNIADAWIYCQNYPPWLEEGGNGYYRVHNAAWGLTAESRYRQTTGDNTFIGFGTTCANYIVSTPLYLGQYAKLNAFCQGWAAGNLYLYGEEWSNSTWMNSAVGYGDALLGWIAYDPPVQLATETWAMSSGTVVWGVCNSSFRDDPAEGQSWIATYGALVDTFQTWYDVPGDAYDWDNSWNVAYLNAHFAMGDISGDPFYTGIGNKLNDQLLSYDTDDDGGIPATTQDPVTEDMSWISCYLAKFGVARALGSPPEIDAGVLRFLDFADGDTIIFGDVPMPIRVEVTNFGLQPLTGVEVRLEGAEIGEATVDLDFVEKEWVELHPGWLPPTGEYEFLVYTVAEGDEVGWNDSLSVHLTVFDATSVDDGAAPKPLALGPVWPNPSSGETHIALRLPEGSPANVAIFGVDGRRVASLRAQPGAARREVLVWDGLDPSGTRVAAGVYLVRARIGDDEFTTRLVRVR